MREKNNIRAWLEYLPHVIIFAISLAGLTEMLIFYIQALKCKLLLGYSDELITVIPVAIAVVYCIYLMIKELTTKATLKLSKS